MKRTLLVLAPAATLLTGALATSSAERAGAAAPLAPGATRVHRPAAFLDKTRFLLHVGAAYYAFGAQAQQNGVHIADVTVPIPGLS